MNKVNLYYKECRDFDDVFFVCSNGEVRGELFLNEDGNWGYRSNNIIYYYGSDYLIDFFKEIQKKLEELNKQAMEEEQ